MTSIHYFKVEKKLTFAISFCSMNWSLHNNIYNPRQENWDTKQVLPLISPSPPTYNVDNEAIFFPLVEKKAQHFPTLIREDEGYII